MPNVYGRLMTSPMLESFPPLVAPGARILILGNMPGVASLQAQRYYAYDRNAFWRLTAALFGFDATAPYDDRVAALRAALEASKAKRRAERAASQHLYEQLRHQEQEPPIESASSSPPPVPTPTPTAQLLYDLDDTHFPMPGGTWSRPTKRPAREDAWPAALPRGARTVLGPRRRPTK